MENVYQMVTDRILERMAQGEIPWQKPWSATKAGLAYNRISGKPYSLLNQLILGIEGEWATFKQWTTLGGQIKKGEEASFVVFWKWLDRKKTDKDNKDDDKDGEKGEDKKERDDKAPYLRYYRVFHISQVDGVEPREDVEKTYDTNEPVAAAEQIKEAYMAVNPTLTITEGKSNRAFYNKAEDKITVPELTQFEEVEEFYSTLFHEMAHSTGHESRLNREDLVKSAGFGSEAYSREELTAEIGAAFLVNHAGLDTEKSFKNSIGYLQNWIKHLKADNRMIVTAAGRAEKAVNYILGA